MKACFEFLPFVSTVKSASGMLSRDVDGVAMAMRALLCQYMFDLDPTVPPIPFREEVSNETSESFKCLLVYSIGMHGIRFSRILLLPI